MNNRKNKIQDAVKKDEPLFISFADADGMQKVGRVKFDHNVIRRTSASKTVREGMNRNDWNAHRPEEAASTEIKQRIRSCMTAYKNVPIVRNVIDLMADFGSKGIDIVHPTKTTQEFLRGWAKQVRLKERAERFLNYLYRTGNVVIKRTHAKLRKDDFERLHADMTMDVKLDSPKKIPKNQIPWTYTYHNPLSLEVVGSDDIAIFTGQVQWALRLPANIAKKIKNPRTDEEKAMMDAVPEYIKNAARKGKSLIPLDPDKISVYHYKKDDWDAWADPLPACILDDLVTLEKLKLADRAALDGAISHIRLWRLGNLEHGIYPTDAAVARLSAMLADSVGGGPVDIIWGPELDLIETKSDIYRFLGSEKYTATLIAIYDGLGIPIVLTGYASKNSGGNNYLSVQTLVERLEYGRNILTEFVQHELAEIQQATGYKGGEASVVYDHMILSDKAAEKSLLIQMADRNLISDETIRERFGEIDELEVLRQKREQKQRDSGKRPRKASQWHNPEHKEAMEKIALQSGISAPSQVGLDLLPAKDGERSAMDMQMELKKSQEAAKKLKGRPGQGRPLTSKDKAKRKKKARTNVQKALTTARMWAKSAQDEISKVVNKWFLDATQKKNLRQLSDDESKELDDLKFAVLCNLNLYSTVDENVIGELITREKPLGIPKSIITLCNATIREFEAKFNKQPNIDELRHIQASVYALFTGDING